MDKILKKICDLLDSDDVELQCSAARVLGEIAPPGKEVRLSLARHLDTPNLTVKHYLLASLERMPGEEVLPYLFTLLREGGKTQEKAAAIISKAGHAAVAQAKRLFLEADAELKKQLVRLLGLIGTEEACYFLVDRIADEGPDLGKQICLSLREAFDRMPRAQRRGGIKKVTAFLGLPRVEENAEKIASGVILLGYLADSSTLGRLLRYISVGQPTAVREQAFIALARMELAGNAVADVVRVVVPMLNEDDYTCIVRHALTLLQRLEIPKKLTAKLKEMLNSKHPSVRSFILSRIGVGASRENITTLLERLNSADFQERRAAQEALGAIPKAYPQILKALDDAKDYESGMRLVSILRAQAPRPAPAEKRRLFDTTERLWKGGDARHDLYAAALAVVDATFLTERIANRLKRMKAARKFKEAVELLRLFSRHALLDDEMKYELAVALLRTQPPDLSPLRRRDDEALTLIAELLGKSSFPLVKRLKAEKALGSEELYHIGFHFAERLFAQREFGVELLKHLVKKSPRGRVGVVARQKLNLVGVTLQK
ncbi:MAG: hypothetical protein NT045_06795 [Candidatus Aureabacteria bacterium]|nr:hypothetical protein [Candidatus Auribacterota bacterium]